MLGNPPHKKCAVLATKELAKRIVKSIHADSTVTEQYEKHLALFVSHADILIYTKKHQCMHVNKAVYSFIAKVCSMLPQCQQGKALRVHQMDRGILPHLK